jgi:hypothetical protein
MKLVIKKEHKMRKDIVVEKDLPGTNENDLIINTKERNQTTCETDDDKPDRLELSLTKGQKRDLIINANKLYGMKPSPLIRMLLKKEGII